MSISEIKNLLHQDITFIEKVLPEDILMEAEGLWDAGAVISGVRSDSAVMQITVVDKNFHYDVGISIIKNKIKLVHCNCVEARQNRICSHIITGIFYLRKEEANGKHGKKSTRPRFDINALMATIERSDLDQFVLQYARKNRSFKLLMQARFFDHLSISEQEQFFDSIYPIHSSPGQKVSAVHLNVFLQIVQEILSHVRHFVLAENYSTAYRLIINILKKSSYISSKLERDHKHFYKKHHALIQLFHTCYERIEAPELRFSAEKDLLELLESNFVGISKPADQSLWLLAYKKTRKPEELYQIVNAYMSNNSRGDQSLIHFLWIALGPMDAWKEKIKKLDVQSIYSIFIFLHKNGDLAFNEEIVLAILTDRKLKPLVFRMGATLLSPPIEGVVFKNRILEYFVVWEDSYYLELLDRLQPDWSAHGDEIKKILESQSSSIPLIKYLIFQDRINEAKSLIRTSLTWHILIAITPDLYPKAPQLLFNLCKTYFQTYLSEHFGEIAMSTVRNQLLEISKFTDRHWIEVLRTHVTTAFPQRV